MLDENQIQHLSQVGQTAFQAFAKTLSILTTRESHCSDPAFFSWSEDESRSQLADLNVAAAGILSAGWEVAFLILMKEADCAVVADLMIGQNGNGKDTLADKDKDAFMEATHQMSGAMATSLRPVLGESLAAGPIELSIAEKGSPPPQLEEGEWVGLQAGLDVEDGITGSTIALLFPEASVAEMMRQTELAGVTAGVGDSIEGEGASVPTGEGEVDTGLPETEATESLEAPVLTSRENEMLQHLVPEREELPAALDIEIANLQMVMDIELSVVARLGELEMPIYEILRLGPGAILEIDKLVDEPVELLVNDKLVARGDVVVVDEKFGIRITEIVSQQKRIESLR